MDIFKCVVTLLGGLAIFLYSMKIMSAGLEAAAGNKLRGILEKLTSNRFLGILVGILIAGLVQSSSTTTVMVVGFVNAGLLNLMQSLWIIMGANIGTNITSQLVAFKFGEIAPLIAIIGVAIILFGKKKKYKAVGDIVTGLGFIFISTNIMSGAMEPIRENEMFMSFLSKMENPFLGVLVGIVFVAIIQSSAAGVAVLQTLAATGVINLDQAVFILYGMHVGTCITAMLSAVGTNRAALKAAMMHLTFNVLGVIIMTTLTLTLPITDWVSKTSSDPMRQIANAHLLFALVTVIVLLPFGKLIVKMINAILPEKKKAKAEATELFYLSPTLFRTDMNTGVVIVSIRNEISRMIELVSKNVDQAFNAVLNNSPEIQEEIDNREETIDFLNKEISFYISHCLAKETSEEDAITLSAMYKITGNLERMGDHATNISGYARLIDDKGYKFSEKALSEVVQMAEVTNSAAKMLMAPDFKGIHVKMAKAEQKIDDMTDMFRSSQIDRMKNLTCSGESSVIYSEMLTDFERIGDHMLNIARDVERYQIKNFLVVKGE